MRRTVKAALVAAALGGMGSLTAAPASAAQATTAPDSAPALVRTVQYYGERRYYDNRRERRLHWREHRRTRDEARIAEAARREAWRIEQERAQRRAWRHAQRERYGYYRGY